MAEPGIDLARCEACGSLHHPAPVWCPACGAASWGVDRVGEGVVEEVTTIHAGDHQAHLASVRVAGEVPVVAGVPAPLPPGTTVSLAHEGEAVTGHPRD